MKKILLVLAIAVVGVSLAVYFFTGQGSSVSKGEAQTENPIKKEGRLFWLHTDPWWVVYFPAGPTRNGNDQICTMSIRQALNGQNASGPVSILLSVGETGYMLGIGSPEPDVISKRAVSLSVDGETLGTFYSHRAKADGDFLDEFSNHHHHQITNEQYVSSAYLPIDQAKILIDRISHGGKILTVDEGEALQILLTNAGQAMENLQHCMDKGKQLGDTFTLDPKPDIYSSWDNTGPWHLMSMDLKTGPGCSMFTVLPDADFIVGLDINDTDYRLNLVSETQSEASSKKIKVSVDGQSIGLLPDGELSAVKRIAPPDDDKPIDAAAGKKTGADPQEYSVKTTLSADQATKLFDLMRAGGKVLTVDAGKPLQVSLEDSDDALANLHDCLEKARALRDAAKP